MHLLLRQKTAICPSMCDNNCDIADQVYSGCIGFDHAYCNAVKGGECQPSGSTQRLRIYMNGNVDENDMIGMKWTSF